jgi:hypothetical protein
LAEEQQTIIGFITCCVTAHPVMPGLTGEIEELYVQSGVGTHRLEIKEIKAGLVRQAVIYMKVQGATNIHTKICVNDEKECQNEEELRTFWQSLGWMNDMTIYSIYSNVPGDVALQYVWDEYQAQI